MILNTLTWRGSIRVFVISNADVNEIGYRSCAAMMRTVMSHETRRDDDDDSDKVHRFIIIEHTWDDFNPFQRGSSHKRKRFLCDISKIQIYTSMRFYDS